MERVGDACKIMGEEKGEASAFDPKFHDNLLKDNR